jgi:hypothetical protein
MGYLRQFLKHVAKRMCRAGKPVQEEQSGIGWIARGEIGKLGSTGET